MGRILHDPHAAMHNINAGIENHITHLQCSTALMFHSFLRP